MRTRLCALLAIFASCFAAYSSFGTIAIVDQQNTLDGFGAGASGIGTGLGQSFTPNLASIDVADFSLQINAVGTATIQLDLFSGAGYGGTLLGSSNMVAISNPSAQNTEFNFATPIVLVPGNVYTFRLTLVSQTGGGSYSLLMSSSNPYAGGTMYNVPGSAVATNDIVFAEGLSVPEPSTWLLSVAALPLCWLLRRRSLRVK